MGSTFGRESQCGRLTWWTHISWHLWGIQNVNNGNFNFENSRTRKENLDIESSICFQSLKSQAKKSKIESYQGQLTSQNSKQGIQAKMGSEARKKHGRLPKHYWTSRTMELLYGTKFEFLGKPIIEQLWSPRD